MKLNKDFSISGWKPEEHIEKMAMFHRNEVSPRIKKHLNIQDENFWDKYKEAVLLGADLYKMRECGVISNIQVRENLDKFIGKLHNK